jgi:hypothetical protein
MRYVFAYESVHAYDLVHFSPRKEKMTFSWNRKAKIMFPGKLNRVHFKIEIGADLYRTGNRMCCKSYGGFLRRFVREIVLVDGPLVK